MLDEIKVTDPRHGWRTSGGKTAPIGDLPATFNVLMSWDLKVILATNNATRTPDQYFRKMAGFGVDLQKDQIINSAMAVGSFAT